MLPARLALPLLVAVALLAAAPARRLRSKGPCVLGQKKPKCFIQTAKVGAIGDGDTFKAQIGNSKQLQLVRMTGIQAMELHSLRQAQGPEGRVQRGQGRGCARPHDPPQDGPARRR